MPPTTATSDEPSLAPAGTCDKGDVPEWAWAIIAIGSVGLVVMIALLVLIVVIILTRHGKTPIQK